MKLYYTPGACSLAPHIAAREAGLEVQLDKVDLAGKTTESGGDYYAVNAKGAVPALEMDDGQVLTENAIVLQYIADQAPGSNLVPASGLARWRLLELVNYIATELHKGFSPLFDPRITPEAREATVAALSKKFDFLQRQIGDRPYLTGETFTIADAYAYAILNWTNLHRVDLSPWPKLQAFLKRVAERPGAAAALRAEGLLN